MIIFILLASIVNPDFQAHWRPLQAPIGGRRRSPGGSPRDRAMAPLPRANRGPSDADSRIPAQGSEKPCQVGSAGWGSARRGAGRNRLCTFLTFSGGILPADG